MIRKALHALCLAAVTAAALPAPTEYTMDMLVEDLHNARLVARVCVLELDTMVLVDSFGDAIGEFEVATLRVDTCYKGGLIKGDTTVVARRNVNMRGWYEPDYRAGERSFMCFTDAWADGIHAFAMTRAKFDITASDSVEPPPVGLGFSDEFAGRLTADTFARLLREIVRDQEFLHVAPLLPYTGAPVDFRTTINLSGGAVLDNVVLTCQPGANRIDMELVYTPCTGICPLIFLVKDTTVSLASLPPGDYTAYRTKANSLLNMVPPPDDTVQFTVYGTTGVLPETHATARPAYAAGRAAAMVVDLRGRTVHGGATFGLVVVDARGLRSVLRAPCQSLKQR